MNIHTLGAAIAAAFTLALIAAAPASALTFTVNNTGDAADDVAQDNFCDSDPGGSVVCTLRAAIQESEDEAVAVADTIDFAAAIVDDPDAADRTINLGAALPNLTEQVTIDGCALATNPPTQPCIGINGFSLGTPVINAISADNVTIRHLAFGNAGGVLGTTALASAATIQSNWFGFTVAAANSPIGSALVVNGDDSNIGGPTDGEGNVFGNSAGTALTVAGDGNQVQGNLIGVAPDGTTAAGNNRGVLVRGLSLGSDADDTTLGGTQPTPGSCTGPCNVIANSTTDGVELQQNTELANNTTIQGNFIGLDQAGALDANNVGINNLNATDSTIGGAAAGQRNYIAGGGTGINAGAQGAPGIEVRNNFIGVATNGTSPLGAPTTSGMIVVSAASSPAIISDNRVAVTAGAVAGISADDDGLPIVTTGPTISGNIVGLGTGNEDLGANSIGLRATQLHEATISGNTFANFTFAGVSLEASHDNVVTGNRFGTDPTGAGEHADPGAIAGVMIDDNPTSSTGNTIGGSTAASENIMSNLPRAIVARVGPNDDNTFGRNRGSNNSLIFIDLGQDGPGNNDLVDPPNNGIDAPQVTSATDDVVAGSGAAASASVLVFQTPDSGDPTDVTSFVGEATASAAGAWQLPVNIPNGTRLTALQTDASGDSSELSSSVAAVADPPETTITGGPKKRSRLKRGKRKKRVTFTFTSSEPGEGGFQCQIDNKPFVLCNDGTFTRKLRRGRHTFRVRAFDDAGNPDPSLAIRSFRIRRARRG